MGFKFFRRVTLRGGTTRMDEKIELVYWSSEPYVYVLGIRLERWRKAILFEVIVLIF